MCELSKEAKHYFTISMVEEWIKLSQSVAYFVNVHESKFTEILH